MINKAEDMASVYDKKIKGGKILKVDCPYEEIISIYKDARIKFEEIGWKDQANRLVGTVKYYNEKLCLKHFVKF